MALSIDRPVKKSTSPYSSPFLLIAPIQQSRIGCGWLGQFGCVVRRNAKGSCPHNDDRPAKHVQKDVETGEDSPDRDRLANVTSPIRTVVSLLRTATTKASAASRIVLAGSVVNTKGREYQEEFEDVIEQNQQPHEYCEKTNRRNGADSRGEEGDRGRQRRQEHGPRSIRQGNGRDLLRRSMRVGKTGVLPLVHRNEDVIGTDSENDEHAEEIEVGD